MVSFRIFSFMFWDSYIMLCSSNCIESVSIYSLYSRRSFIFTSSSTPKNNNYLEQLVLFSVMNLAVYIAYSNLWKLIRLFFRQ